MTPAQILAGLAALTTDRTHFRDIAEASGHSLHWTDVTLQGVRHRAVRVAPPARLRWRVYVLAASQIRVWCATGTEATGQEAVRFTVEAHSESTEAHASIAVTPADGWRELRLPLPPAFAGEVSIELVADPSAASGTAALWGDPMLERRLAAAEIAAAGMAAVRLLGPRRVLHRTAAAASREEDTERYRHWLATRPSHAPAMPRSRALVSVLTPVFNTDPVWLRQCIESVRRQTYPHWELILSDDGSTDRRTLEVLDAAAADPRIRVVRSAANGGIVRASNAALAAASGEFVAFLDHDDELAPEALAEMVACADEYGIDIVYSDEDKMDPSGARGEPHFKPDWSPELLLSCMYMSHLTVMRRRLAVDAGGFREGYDGSQDYDLMLRAVERTNGVGHVPKVLYSWRKAPLSAASSQLAKPWAARAAQRALEDALQRRGIAAVVLPAGATGHFRVRHAILGAPVVSVLILLADATPVDSVAPLLRALAKTTTGRVLEIVLGHDRTLSVSPAAIAALGSLRYRTVACEPGRGRSSGLNALARAASGDHLLILDPDIEPFEAGWLDAMLEFSQQPAIGAVGAILLQRDDTIAHAGIVIGAGGVAARAFSGEPAWTRGHLSNTLDVRNCSAAGGGCLLTRRAVFDRVGGFDERLGPGAAEIGYGFALREAGLRVVVTPHARLRAGAGIAAIDSIPDAEASRLRERWGAWLDADPFYNPNFDRREAGFRLPQASAPILST
jgi:GT2 family glycosyltransferase